MHYNPQIDRKLTRMRQTVSNFINDGLHDDTELGMVSFSSSAHVLYPMSRVNSTSVKHALLRDLPKLAEGGTSIGSGMQKALEVCLMTSVYDYDVIISVLKKTNNTVLTSELFKLSQC